MNKLLFFLSGLVFSTTILAGPFDDGTKRRLLTPAEITNLLQYADNSKARLDKALEEGKGQDLDGKLAAYWPAVTQVVINSYQSKPRSELLMRICLNQALEMTYGLPIVDGVPVRGVLAGAANPGLQIRILEESILAATTYYQDDRLAIQKGSFDSLPYAKIAYEQIKRGRGWLSSVLEYGYQYQASMKLLEHWQNIILSENNQAQTLFAEEIILVERLLNAQPDTTKKVASSQEALVEEVRYLRGVHENLEASSSKKVEILERGKRQ